MSGSKAQKGFTLIEVSLAIVIGVIVLAGAITLYNQSKVSAGNSKLQEKSLALAGLVEEMSAQANGVFPTAAAVQSRWEALRDDAKNSPYGGALTTSIASPDAFVWQETMTDTAGNTKALETVAASAGVLIYSTGPSAWAWDVSAGASKSVRGYFVAGADNTGTSLAFLNGGK